MQLVNWSGPLVGPGSEWFWSAVSAVVVTVSLVAIYHQLRLQSSANALAQMESIDHEWRTEPMIRSRLAILFVHRDKSVLSQGFQAISVIGDYFERLGYLVRSGSVPQALAYEYVGTQVRTWWGWCAPIAHAYREASNEPTALEHFEWLAGVMADMDGKKGIINARDQAWRDRSAQDAIDGNVEALRVAEELRTVVFRPMSPPPVTAEGGDSAPKRSRRASRRAEVPTA